jgi:peptide-methionine (S)-S-oxide reductase
MSNGSKIAIFAAGCFWHIEEAFSKLEGVKKTVVGYTGGHTKNPTYEDVCFGKTGHAEAVLVQYNPKDVTYQDLLKIFWHIHDPTSFHKQGPDIGSQYRSALFYHDKIQRDEALKSRDKLQKSKKFKNKKIVTEIVKSSKFYPAEEYHQKYYSKHKIQKAFMCRF